MKKNILMAIVATTMMVTGLQAQKGAELEPIQKIRTGPKPFVPLQELQKPAAPAPTNLVEAKKQELVDLQAQKKQVTDALEVQKATLLDTQSKLVDLQQQQKLTALQSLQKIADVAQKELTLLQQKLQTAQKAEAQKQTELVKLQAAQK